MASLTTEEIYQRVGSLAKPLLGAGGVDLVELKIGRHQGAILIQITADKPMGSITIEECGALNKALVQAIDEAGFLPLDGYALELSSPGLDRPLTTHKDFLRALNYDIHFWLHEPLEGKKEIEGLLVGATEAALTVYTVKKQELVLPLGQVAKGKRVI